jgi:hypothetical protein
MLLWGPENRSGRWDRRVAVPKARGGAEAP